MPSYASKYFFVFLQIIMVVGILIAYSPKNHTVVETDSNRLGEENPMNTEKLRINGEITKVFS